MSPARASRQIDSKAFAIFSIPRSMLASFTFAYPSTRPGCSWY
ncbi:MAG TPA: hypothetical protein VIJ33_10295 [Solirubrobacteraceae bacterium]